MVLKVIIERRPCLDIDLTQIGSTVRTTFDSLTLYLAETREYSDLVEEDPTYKVSYMAKHNNGTPLIYDIFEGDSFTWRDGGNEVYDIDGKPRWEDLIVSDSTVETSWSDIPRVWTNDYWA